jgi:zinc/manganese transport system permease protein
MSFPFSWNLVTDFRVMFEFAFMRNAYEAGTIIAVLAGLMGYVVVLRRSAFAAHAIGHTGFSGAAGAVLIGVNPVYGLLAFTMGGGTAMALLGRRASTRDIEIGTVLAFLLGIGLVFLSEYHGYATEAYSILFGEILGISVAGVWLTVEGAAISLVVLALIYRPLLFSSLDEEVAEAKGLPMLPINVGFMLLLAVAISFAVQIVGVLLIFALMVTPAATAVRLTRRPRSAAIVAVLIALAATWIGLLVSFPWSFSGQTSTLSNWPVSFYIVAIAFGLYVGVRAASWIAGYVVPRRSPGPGVDADAEPRSA